MTAKSVIKNLFVVRQAIAAESFFVMLLVHRNRYKSEWAKKLQFLPYGRSMDMSYTQDVYMSHGTEYDTI
jgi:hypothetical protein